MKRFVDVVLGVVLGAVLVAALASLALAQTPQGGTSIVAKQPPDTKAPTGVMTWDKVAGNWKNFRGLLRRQWGKLTHDDLAVAQGNREVLVGKIQSRYGIDKDKADKQVDAWLKTQK